MDQQLGVASTFQALVQCGAEVECLQAAVKVVLDEVEELLVLPYVFLALQDYFHHLKQQN